MTPFVSWLAAAAGQAEEAASQARAAAAAYEMTFALTVPPPVIAANRVLLATLVATNFFGQNTPAIAATEADYLEMWAQDAVAMFGYAASSALATQLSRFAEPPATANADGVAAQSAAVSQAGSSPVGNAAQATIPQLLSAAAFPQAAQQFAASPAAVVTDRGLIGNTIANFLQYGLPTPSNNWAGLVPANYDTVLKRALQGYFGNGLAAFGMSIWQQTFQGLGTTAGAGGAWYPTPQFAALGAGGFHFHAGSPASLSASLSAAPKVGGLSVPASWLGGVEPSSPAAKVMSANFVSAAAEAEGAPGVNALGGVPVGARGAQRAGNLGVRYGFRYNILTRPPSAG